MLPMKLPSLPWLGVFALACACSDHEPELERIGGIGGSVADSGAAGGQGGQSGSDGGCAAPSAQNPTFPCEVEAVLKAKCHRCHQDPQQNGAPFPLLTWENTQVDYFGKPIYQRMESVVSSDFMPFTSLALNPPVEPLTADEKATLLDWLVCAIPADGAVCP
jgi:hypothetical protein